MIESVQAKQWQRELPGHYTFIENSVSSGMPDVYISRNHCSTMVEFKDLSAGKILVRPAQWTWHRRQFKHGEDSWLAWWGLCGNPVVAHSRHLVTHSGFHMGKSHGLIEFDVTEWNQVVGFDRIDALLFGSFGEGCS